MKEIQLTQGYFTQVDDEDYEYLNQWKWHCNSYNYAGRGITVETGNIHIIRIESCTCFRNIQ